MKILTQITSVPVILHRLAECKLIDPKLVEIKPKHFAACIRISPEKPYIDENVAEGLGAIGH